MAQNKRTGGKKAQFISKCETDEANGNEVQGGGFCRNRHMGTREKEAKKPESQQTGSHPKKNRKEEGKEATRPPTGRGAGKRQKNKRARRR